MKRLTEAIGKKDSRFTGELRQMGSSLEGTRIGDPDEYDFAIILTKFSNTLRKPIPSNLIGFYSLKMDSDRETRKTFETDEHRCEHNDHPYDFREFFEDEFLHTTLVQQKFETLIAQVLLDSEFWSNELYLELSVKSSKIWEARQAAHHSVCLTLTLQVSRKIGDENGDYFFSDISVDIVPSLQIKGWLPDEAVFPFSDDDATDNLLSGSGCILVFSQPNRVYEGIRYSRTSARVSYAIAESRLIKSCPPVVKAAYMIGKVLQKYTTESMFSSYVLKTAVLLSVAEVFTSCKDLNQAPSNVDPKVLTDWIRRILSHLFAFALHDDVPTFFMPTFLLPVWKFESYVQFTKLSLQRRDLDYLDCGAEFGDIGRGVALIHLLYWSVLEDGADIVVKLPDISNYRKVVYS